MENSNFNLPVSIQKQKVTETNSSFDGRLLGIFLSLCLLVGMLAYIDRWVPFLSNLF